MSVKVELRKIIDEIEMQMEDHLSLLHIKTGEILALPLEQVDAAEDDEPYEDLLDWEQELREMANDYIENKEDYIELPDKDEINEYRMIEDFCSTVEDQKIQSILFREINGKGAFRRFKDAIYEFGIEKQWYDYRNEIYKEIAIEWCKQHNLTYVE